MAQFHGLEVYRPPVRSSQAQRALANPFQYLLQDRLALRPTEETYAQGIVKREDSSAMQTGTVFHWCLEHLHEPDWYGRATMLPGNEAATRLGITMARACTSLKPWGLHRNLLEWLNDRQTLAKEYPLAWHNPLLHVSCYGLVDRLVYHHGAVWILDYKTTSMSPMDRARRCAFDFQTQHYMAGVLSNWLKILQEFDLPSDTRFGGFQHVIVQRPPLKMGPADRPFRAEIHTLKSGPRKGQQEVRRIYLSDQPDPDLYFQRVFEWYVGSGYYADRSVLLHDQAHYPLLVKTTTPDSLGDGWTYEYNAVLQRFALVQTAPVNDNWQTFFPRVPGRFLEQPWEAFYDHHPSEWKRLTEMYKLTQAPRPGDVPLG